ncbi:hypothetical protein HK102_008778 [Quaeritorhiza haematococci]|nr:hypothetical protein HK102_008778 [Quaeritorhiza haematococci]
MFLDPLGENPVDDFLSKKQSQKRPCLTRQFDSNLRQLLRTLFLKHRFQKTQSFKYDRSKEKHPQTAVAIPTRPQTQPELLNLIQQITRELIANYGGIAYGFARTNLWRLKAAWLVGMELARQRGFFQGIPAETSSLSTNQRINDTQQKLLRFINQLINVGAPMSEELLLDFVLYHTRLGSYEAANNKLVGSISVHPMSENGVLVGYAGLLYILMWILEVSFVTNFSQETEGFSFEAGYSPDPSDFTNSVHYREALVHFEKAFALGGPLEAFVPCKIRLLAASEDEESTRTLLQNFSVENCENPNAHRMNFKHLTDDSEHDSRKDEDSDRDDVARRLLELDPVDNDALLHLVRTYEQQILDGDMDAADAEDISVRIVELLANALDFSVSPLQSAEYPREIWKWEKLAEHLCRLRACDSTADCHVWDERVSWWPSAHYKSCYQITSRRSSDDSYDVEKLAVLKGICALYIFPELYPSLHWPFHALNKSSNPVLSHGFARQRKLHFEPSVVVEREAIKPEPFKYQLRQEISEIVAYHGFDDETVLAFCDPRHNESGLRAAKTFAEPRKKRYPGRAHQAFMSGRGLNPNRGAAGEVKMKKPRYVLQGIKTKKRSANDGSESDRWVWIDETSSIQADYEVIGRPPLPELSAGPGQEWQFVGEVFLGHTVSDMLRNPHSFYRAYRQSRGHPPPPGVMEQLFEYHQMLLNTETKRRHPDLNSEEVLEVLRRPPRKPAKKKRRIVSSYFVDSSDSEA